MSDNVEPLKLPLHPIIRTRLITLMGENETLQYEIEKLRAALKPFANIANKHDQLDDEDYISVHPYGIKLKHFRAIRDVMGEKR